MAQQDSETPDLSDPRNDGDSPLEKLAGVAEAFDDASETVGEAMANAADAAVETLVGVAEPHGETEEFSHSGMSLVAEHHGDPDASQTIVLLHGIGMGRRVFVELVNHLAPYAQVVTIDQPGYGEADEPPRTPTMARVADLIAVYLRERGYGPIALLGHSMGTQVATEIAVRHPSLVSRLILVAPTVNRTRRHALTQLILLARDLVGESPKVLLLGAREYLRAGPNLRRKMKAMLAHRPEDRYPLVQAPALVLRGEHDRVSPRGWGDEVVSLLPEAELSEIAGHRHETLIRDAEPAARILRRFLEIE